MCPDCQRPDCADFNSESGMDSSAVNDCKDVALALLRAELVATRARVTTLEADLDFERDCLAAAQRNAHTLSDALRAERARRCTCSPAIHGRSCPQNPHYDVTPDAPEEPVG